MGSVSRKKRKKVFVHGYGGELTVRYHYAVFALNGLIRDSFRKIDR